MPFITVSNKYYKPFDSCSLHTYIFYLLENITFMEVNRQINFIKLKTSESTVLAFYTAGRMMNFSSLLISTASYTWFALLASSIMASFVLWLMRNNRH